MSSVATGLVIAAGIAPLAAVTGAATVLWFNRHKTVRFPTAPEPTPEHHNPLLVTVLPKERRARHVYQMAGMVMLIGIGVYQLWFGPNPKSSVNDLDHQAQLMLYWCGIIGGISGLAAAVIPERVVRWPWDFDATYWRLFDELAAHLLCGSVWASYLITFWVGSGPGFAPIVAGMFAVASATRAGQILLTLARAGVFSRRPSAIVGTNTMRGDDA